MITVFLLAFIFCLISEMIANGEAYIIFSSLLITFNSIGRDSIGSAVNRDRYIEIPYFYGKYRFSIMIMKREPLKWTGVGSLENGKWVNRTRYVLYYSGPFKNFHGLGLTPRHIIPTTEKFSFAFIDGSVIHVNKDQCIVPTIKEFYRKYEQTDEAKKN